MPWPWYIQVHGPTVFKFMALLYSSSWPCYIQVYGPGIFKFITLLYSSLWPCYIQVHGPAIFKFMALLYSSFPKMSPVLYNHKICCPKLRRSQQKTISWEKIAFPKLEQKPSNPPQALKQTKEEGSNLVQKISVQSHPLSQIKKKKNHIGLMKHTRSAILCEASLWGVLQTASEDKRFATCGRKDSKLQSQSNLFPFSLNVVSLKMCLD